ncbi:MAG TPA: DUF2062 domain-containing protein, partial [Polyangia bacterium]
MRRTWRARVRAAVARVLHENATPARLGWSVGLGVFIACTPLYGLQTLLALGAAWLLRLNRVATLTAAQITMPPLAPLFIFGAVQIGAWLLHGRFLVIGLADFRGPGAVALGRSLLGAWVLGGVVLGAALGALLGLATAGVVRARRRDGGAALLAAAQRRAAARYAGAPP